MRITMKTLYSTPAFTAAPGDTIDVPGKLAKELIARRYAVAAKADPVKTAAAKAAAPPDDGDGRPRNSASKDDWVVYVTEEYDLDVDEAAAMTKRQLIAYDEAGGDVEGDDDGDDPDDDSDEDDEE